MRFIEPLESRLLFAAGNLDTTFGVGGLVTTDARPPSGSQISGVAMASGGKIVAVGTSGGAIIAARYNSDGSLDTSFGTGGIALANIIPGGGTGNGVAVTGDDKVVIAAQTGAGQFAVLRLNSNGTVDTSFGGSGFVIAPFQTTFGEAFSVTLQADGKIVAGGSILSDNGDLDFALARFNPDGSIDQSFGSGSGLVATDFLNGDDVIHQITLDGNGNIVAAGSANLNGEIDFGVARYTSNGITDFSFNGTGKITTDFGGVDQAFSVAVQSDQKIVAVGGGGSGDFTMVRYNADGTLDLSFGFGGLFFTDFSHGTDQANQVLIQPDGRIIAAGQSSVGGFALARYTPFGMLDTTFGIGGTTTTSFSKTGSQTVTGQAKSALLQPDGNIVLGGLAVPTGTEFALARYQGDRSFATLANGVLTVNGSDQADVITLSTTSGSIAVTINSAPFSFPIANVSQIFIYSYQGNDLVIVGGGVIGSSIYGGQGNDTLFGGSGDDQIFGGKGDDVLTGGDGNDIIKGQADNDMIYGNIGNDILFGGIGNDMIWGGQGDDQITGGTENDTLIGGLGNDVIFARDGFIDSVDGGDGTNAAQVDVIDTVLNIQVFLA